MNKCEDCANSVGIVDGERIWCAEVGGVMSKMQYCAEFKERVKDEPIIIDHWPADNTD